ncbi:hypothetical protein [Pseudorhodoferax soli]|uniref:hypothetical protein n=1 Tax=Pseudorhodoferax soli TaxID=545864 RepID=UPI001474376F|nr:hypothetical protein [Pseudorhodoferax soli]
MASIADAALPGLVLMANAGRYTDYSSLGYLVPADPQWFQPSIAANGFDLTKAHRQGFSITGARDPVNGSTLNENLFLINARTLTTPLAGIPVTRHASDFADVDDPNSPNTVLQKSWWVVDHNLASYGAVYSTFALWSYVGSAHSGYFSGRPTFWGAYAYGSPTSPSEIPTSGLTQYSGLAGMQYLFPAWDRMYSNYGPVRITFDAGSQTATVNVDVVSTYSIVHFQPIGGPSTHSESNDVGNPQGPVSTLTCTANVDMATGMFRCVLPSNANTEVSGRFYGPAASEVSGVARTYTASGSNSNWGMIGGFTAKRD